VFNRGGGDRVVWRVPTGVIHCVFDQIPDSKPTKLLYHPKQKPRKGGGLRQIKKLPPNPFTGHFSRKANI
jgi:hypothetical protein